MNTLLQVRVDEKMKESARKVFAAVGLDLSSGVKMYLSHVSRTKALPYEMFTADNFSPAKKRRLMREADEAVKYSKGYRTAKELHDDILGR